MKKIKDILIVLLLGLVAALLFVMLFERINMYQVSLIKIEAAKAEREAAVYLEEAEMLKHEDTILSSNMYRMHLKTYLIQHGIKEEDVDRFIEENSK